MSSNSGTRSSPLPLLILGIIFHAVFLSSIFSLWFVSPVLHVSERYSTLDGNDLQAPADRVVLIVGDGLRADKLFSLYPEPAFPNQASLPDIYNASLSVLRRRGTPAPYLRSLVEDGIASWGISHTRVPTESRPGHVAMISGLYEDPSAVLTGWKHNPVVFDSVLNQSTHAYAFGSPDIVPMFRDGASPPEKVSQLCYEAEDEDFSQDAIQCDIWVLERLQELLRNSTTDATLDAEIRQSGNVFFLHLLGIDTTGHAYRPHSPEYHRNIQVVDSIVKQTVDLFEDFFHDGRTTFVFTADHGMSNIGNHGDGHPDNTRTPLIAWGSGIKASSQDLQSHDEYSDPWFLTTERKDVAQADVAALMSTLVGIPFPANGVGQVPLHYLDASEVFKAHAAMANAKAVLAQYRTGRDQKSRQVINFKPYPELTGSEKSDEQRLASILQAINRQEYASAEEHCRELLDLAKEGLRYFHTYNWLFLQSVIVLGYLGWMATGALFVISNHTGFRAETKSQSSLSYAVFCAIFALLSAKLVKEEAPWTHYLYVAFPCYFWSSVFGQWSTIKAIFTKRRQSISMTSMLAVEGIVLLSLEACVYGYFDRRSWTAGFFLIGILWPFLGTPQKFRDDQRALGAAWSMSCIATGVFTLLPVEKGENLTVIGITGSIFTILILLVLKKAAGDEKNRTVRRYLALEAGLIVISTTVAILSARKLRAKEGLPSINRIVAWTIINASVVVCYDVVHKIHNRIHRLIALVFAFAPTMLLLSISHEALFYLFFSLNLLLWLVFETKLHQYTRPAQSNPKTKRNIDLGDLRLALYFLFYIHVGFFGLGNVASISSFYLESVYRLIPVFNPFSMSLLLLYKILIPFLIVAAVASTLNSQLNLPPFALFLVTLALSDVLTLNFFFLVTDSGSWLQIGQSISHFSIASLLLVFMGVLFTLGDALMRGSL